MCGRSAVARMERILFSLSKKRSYGPEWPYIGRILHREWRSRACRPLPPPALPPDPLFPGIDLPVAGMGTIFPSKRHFFDREALRIVRRDDKCAIGTGESLEHSGHVLGKILSLIQNGISGAFQWMRFLKPAPGLLWPRESDHTSWQLDGLPPNDFYGMDL